MIDREDYTGARVLGTIEHLGETFFLVRLRRNGKPFGKGLALTHGGVNMAFNSRISSVAEAISEFKGQFQKVFKDRTTLLAEIQTAKHRAAGHCD